MSMPTITQSLLIPIQVKANNRIPVFVIPGAGGNVFGFMELVESLNLPNSIYGLQPRGLDGITPPHKSVIEAAEHYLKEINNLRLRSPIHLLGHSFGGWVALELGFRLLKTGRRIESLIIVDSDLPNEDETPPIFDDTIVFMKYVEVLEQMTEASWGILDGDVRSLNRSDRLELLHKKMIHFKLIPGRSRPDVLKGPTTVFAACLSTLYAPTFVYPYPAYLILMDEKAMDLEANKRRQQKLIAGWSKITTNLVYWHSPGNHMSALKSPHVHLVADWMRNIFSDAQVPQITK